MRDFRDEIRFAGWIAISFYRQVMSCSHYPTSEISASLLLIFQRLEEGLEVALAEALAAALALFIGFFEMW